MPSVTPNVATRRCTCVERLVLLFQELHYLTQLLISRTVQAFDFSSYCNHVQQPSIYRNHFAIHERVLEPETALLARSPRLPTFCIVTTPSAAPSLPVPETSYPGQTPRLCTLELSVHYDSDVLKFCRHEVGGMHSAPFGDVRMKNEMPDILGMTITDTDKWS